MEHGFEYFIRSSRLVQSSSESTSTNKNVIALDYTKSQSIMSPWRTMVDEIRILDVSQILRSSTADGRENPDLHQNQQYQILLGLGCMAWSGGMLNASPFCLYRKIRQDE